MSFYAFKTWVRSLFGDHEDAENNVKTYVDDAMSQVIVHEFDTTDSANAVASAIQDTTAKAFFVASRACRVQEAFFVPAVSATVTTSQSLTFAVIIDRTGSGTTFASGNGSATYTATHSVTSHIAGISSETGGSTAGYSHSLSGLAQNLAGAPNRMSLVSGTNGRQLFPGDILRFRIAKGATGALFTGGSIQVRVTQGEAS